MGEVIFTVLLLGGLAVWGIWGIANNPKVRSYLALRRLRGATMMSLAGLPDSTPGRVFGHAQVLEEELRSPLTGRACVYYEVRVGEGKRGGISVLYERRGVPFMLVDGHSRAIVIPTHAELSLDFDAETWSGTFDDPTPREAELLQRHGKRGAGWLFNKRLQYREAVVEVGERIAVLASGVREPDPDAVPGSYRGPSPTRLVLSGTAKSPIVLSDKYQATDVI